MHSAYTPTNHGGYTILIMEFVIWGYPKKGVLESSNRCTYPDNRKDQAWTICLSAVLIYAVYFDTNSYRIQTEG